MTQIPDERRAALVDDLCGHLASGAHASQWYGQNGNPGHSAVWRWRKERPDWDEAIEAARAAGAHVLVDAAVAIADGEHPVAQGKEAYPGQRRTQVWARFEAAKRLNPRNYGDKVDVTSDGKRVGEPVDRDTAAREMAAILAMAAARTEPPQGAA